MCLQILFYIIWFLQWAVGWLEGKVPQRWKLAQGFCIGIWPNSVCWTRSEDWGAGPGKRWVSQSPFRNGMWTSSKIAVMLSFRVWINPLLSLLTSMKLILTTESQPMAQALRLIKSVTGEAVESICNKYSEGHHSGLCWGLCVISGKRSYAFLQRKREGRGKGTGGENLLLSGQSWPWVLPPLHSRWKPGLTFSFFPFHRPRHHSSLHYLVLESFLPWSSPSFGK